MKSQFITPVVTVFDEKGRLDPEGNKRVYDHLVQGGVTGMVIMGSTGEFFSMDMKTSKELIDIAVPYVKGKIRVFVGTSRMDPLESIELANYAQDKGADGVMIISPYYFSLSEESIFAYYDAIAGAVETPIFLYNFPARTGYSISPKVTLKLADKHENIMGFKDTILEMGHTCDLIKTVKSEFPYFEVFSGFDNNFAHNILAGGNGCIGGLSNIIPEFFADWMQALAKQDLDLIAKHQKYVDGMMDLYNIGNPFIPITKKALILRGLPISDYCSPPFLRATLEQTNKIQALLDAMNIKKVS